MRVLLPSLNRKLHGKEHSSFAHAFEVAQIEEGCLGEVWRKPGAMWKTKRAASILVTTTLAVGPFLGQ